jgi:CRP-like cAMP-binding protein
MKALGQQSACATFSMTGLRRRSMLNRLTRKLEAFGPLPEADQLLLDDVIRPARAVGPRTDLIQEGDTPSDVNLILEGFACRYKVLPTGRRQIMAYLVPGDFCDLHVFILKTMDHTIATLSACTVVKIPRARILELMERPAIAKAFWWAALVDEATLREWLVNIGVRRSEQRVGHLLCELLLRLRTVGLTNGDSFELPITQAELADTVSLTGVHVNRILQRLRTGGLITLKGKNLVILDVERLTAFSGFNPSYLHLAEQDGHPALGP